MMASTLFVNGTVIQADWLNDVNTAVYNNRFYPETYGAVGDGVTNDDAALAACNAAAAAAAPSTVVLSQRYATATTFVKYHQVSYSYEGAGEIVWKGSTSGICVETDPTNVVRDAAWKNVKINTGESFAGTALRFHSSVGILVDTITLTMTGSTSKAVVFTADSTGGETGSFNRNCGAHKIGAITVYGVCGTVIESSGVSPGYNGSPQVVTLLTIGHVFSLESKEFGINFKNYTDNNTFSGTVRVGLTANNAVGLQIGDAGSAGVYMNSFDILAVDTFAGYTGRIACNLEDSKTTSVRCLYNTPEAEGGVVVTGNGCKSFYIAHYRDTNDESDGEIVEYQRKRRIAGEGFNGSAPVVLQDDTVAAFNIAEAGIQENLYVIFHITASDPESSCGVWLNCRRTSGIPQIKLLYPATTSTISVGTGVLTNGTSDGVDGDFNVHAAADGKVYIKNRRGAEVSFVYTPTSWFPGN